MNFHDNGNRKYTDPWLRPVAPIRIAKPRPPSAFKRFIFGYWRELSIIAGIVLAMFVIVKLFGCRMVAL